MDYRRITCVMIALVAVFFLVPAMVQTQTLIWHKLTNPIVAWDAVAKVDPADDAVRYQVYITYGTPPAGAVKVGNLITVTQLQVAVPVDVKAYLGIQAYRYKAGAQLGDPSTIAWSNDPTVCANGQPFGIDTIRQILFPKNIKITNPTQ